jgi:hypothetical protein
MLELWIMRISFPLGVKYDAEKEEKAAQEAKQKQLKKVEDAKQAEREKGLYITGWEEGPSPLRRGPIS